MERDDLKELWSRCEVYLKRSERLNELVVADSLAQKAQNRLSGEQRLLAFEIVANFGALIILVAIGFGRAGTLSATIATAVLGAALIALNVALIAIAVALKRIDFGEPVVAVQASLERIKIRRAALTATVLLAAPLLWAPLLVVVFALFGADAMRMLGVPYLAANAVLGAAVAAAGWAAAHRFRRRFAGCNWLGRAVDALSGNAYREAAEFLDTIQRFRMTA